MKLNFLGTGAGVPSKERNVSSIVLDLLQEQGNNWMFDCGESTQHQILSTNIRPRKIEKIFITHLHGDHIYGLPGFLSSRSFQNGETNLTIYGPKGIKEFVETSLNVSGTRLTYQLIFIELFEGLIIDNNHFRVFAKKLEHGVESFGFRIEEKSKPGQLQSNKLKEVGIQPGPIYQQIKENEQVQLENGQVIYRKDFIGKEKPGRIVCIMGDTRYIPDLQAFVKEADVLIHEATFERNQEKLAHDYFHSTTEQAAKLARNSNVNRLILTHISSRYQKESSQLLLDEAQKVFPDTTIAYDFYETEIPAK
ncbi:ribonuclease Z [Aquibacillus rhizosphaerae]|uniref:Ribonuclease Z n=1 Tax=Aquibacillus rhizosphaerae TaxID=3051431 RepID=A0ABT7L4C3_9BACI|nr:ribonuclease Z [Aquibacillus sp. LR5S19]MDL4840721.1 ribonuclease Z [Aquibacillus sp. LR5S19]